MAKHVDWLRKELDAWVRDGVVGADQAEAIRARYPEPQAGPPWAAIIFSGLGAVIVGLGIILLFAYNWQAMPKAAKLAAIFGALIAAHWGGIVLVTGKHYRGVGEALCLLGTMLFGAGIWLVAQIYHIEEHFPNGVLIWGVGALAMAWALPSVAQGVAAAVLFTVWTCIEVGEFHAPMHLAPLIIAFLIGGLAWRLRSRVLLALVIPAFAVSLIANTGTIEDNFIGAAILAVGVLLIALSTLAARREVFPTASPVLAVYGWGCYLVMTYALTFPDVVDEALERLYSFDRPWATTYATVFLVVCFAAWALVGALAVSGRVKPRDSTQSLHLALPPLALLFCLVCPPLIERASEWAPAAIFNLVFLAHAAALMAQGCRTGEMRPTVMGCVMLSALALARYFDLFDSLVARGVVFVVVGAVIFAEGILASRARARRMEGAP